MTRKTLWTKRKHREMQKYKAEIQSEEAVQSRIVCVVRTNALVEAVPDSLQLKKCQKKEKQVGLQQSCWCKNCISVTI